SPAWSWTTAVPSRSWAPSPGISAAGSWKRWVARPEHPRGGRRVQVGWGWGAALPGMPFNQRLTVPVELPLRTSGDGGLRFAVQARELEALHDWRTVLGNATGGNHR